jgi:glycosyltransferase involved in cell wall biosynthesis/Tfp pilus assembly protein PilF
LPSKKDFGERVLKVLFKNRPNAFTQRGGDTVVMERTAEALKALGVEVVFDVQGSMSPQGFDLVHLFNFTLPMLVNVYAEQAVRAGVPYVVTSLLEDVETFHYQSHAWANVLIEYVKVGQVAAFYEQGARIAQTVGPCQRIDTTFTANNAASILTTGAGETAIVRSHYPRAKKIQEVFLGSEVSSAVDPALFFNAYGIKDFVLCVGRIESRKNQLMLLKALEESDRTLVFAGGGFTYQPEYAQAVKNFKRKGRTIILDKISQEMLASAYSNAAVHVIPSWFELPGMVTIEAARYGCPVVATDRGSTRDYMKNFATYCDPANPSSILKAVEQVCSHRMTSEERMALQQHASTFTWQKTAQAIYEIYKQVVPGVTKETISMEQKIPAMGVQGQSPVVVDSSLHTEGFAELLERGEVAAREKNVDKAQEILADAEAMNPYSVRLLRTRGALFLAQGKVREANWYFNRALSVDPKDARSLNGLGMCKMNESLPKEAYALFIKALEVDPFNIVGIFQLVQSSYQVNRFDDLEIALRRYLSKMTDDNEIRFCLAGCLLRLEKFAEAMLENNMVLQAKPDYKGALELRGVIEQRSREKMTASTPQAKPLVSTVTAVSAPFVTPAAPKSVTAAPTPPTKAAQPTPPVDVESCLGMAEEAKRVRKYDEARSLAGQILAAPHASEGLRAEALSLQAEIEGISGSVEKAQQAFNDIIAQYPRCARAHSGLGAILASQNNMDGAIAQFNKALEIAPMLDSALAGTAFSKARKGELHTAWEFYVKALKVNVENQTALIGCVQLGYHLEKLPELEKVLREYLELHAGDVDFTYSLAGCCYAQGKYRETMSLCDQIELFSPKNPRAVELRNEVRARMSVGGLGITVS